MSYCVNRTPLRVRLALCVVQLETAGVLIKRLYEMHGATMKIVTNICAGLCYLSSALVLCLPWASRRRRTAWVWEVVIAGDLINDLGRSPMYDVPLLWNCGGTLSCW